MCKFLAKHHTEEDWREITYEEALDILFGTYKDNREVRGWLDDPGTIQCLYSEIKVIAE